MRKFALVIDNGFYYWIELEADELQTSNSCTF